VSVRFALPLLLVPLIVVACGGGSSKPKEPPRLTQKEFVAAANKVCIDSDRRIFRIGALSINPSGWARTAAAAKLAIADMRAVRPPLSALLGFDRMMRNAVEVRRQIQLVHDALVEHKFAKARKAQFAATNADSRIKRQAKKLGLTFCEQLLTNWPA
jgi:hypothetical protein